MKSETRKTKLNYSFPRLALIFLTVLIGIGTAQAGTLTVNSSGDNSVAQCDDVLTLREALLIAKGGNALGRPLTTGERNQLGGATFAGAIPPAGCSVTQNYWSVTSGVGAAITDQINFANNVGVIGLTSGLPNVTWAEDVIDGLKGDGTKAAIDGTNAGSVPGLRVIATVGFTIRNLIIRNFQYEGILVEGSTNGLYEGMEIRNNGRDGILFTTFTDISGTYNSRDNRVGGPGVSQRNFIYSNGFGGIAILASPTSDRGGNQNNIIENNYIGLKDNNGNADFGNNWDGIYLEHAWSNVIGGDSPASRNVISGNNGNGILVAKSGSYNNRIFNNFVGTNKDGNAVIGNNLTGIALSQEAGLNGSPALANKIGDVGKGNVISGNYFGVGIFDANTSNSVVRGNFIGTDTAASLNLGNTNAGIYINLAHDNAIGGTAAGEQNVIAYNAAAGVYIENGTKNAIRANRIFLNNSLGIDLAPAGVTLNDFNDTDTGPNNLQNFPLISTSSSGGGSTSVNGSINSTANTTLTLDFFINPNPDPSNYGEGSTYIGSTTVTTNNIGNAGFNSSFNTFLNYSGFYATATATDADGNTSEFSPAVGIGCSYNISSTSQNFGAAGGTGSFNVTTTGNCFWQAGISDSWITITSGGSGTGNGTLNFSVAANSGPARTGTITVGGRTFTINQASNCTYSLPLNSASYSSGGAANQGFPVQSPAGCLWAATSNNSWITVTSYTGSGNGEFVFSVAANTGPARQGTITAAGLTFTVNQASGCAYQLSHFSAGYPASGTNFDGVSVITVSGCVWMANSNANWITITGGSSGSGSGNTTWSVAANTGAARQGTLTVAGLTFTINQAAAPRRTPFDFDGDGKTDISIFRPSVGQWWYYRSSDGGNYAATFGNSSDKLVPGDYTGDGRADIAVWRPSTGEWFILRSEDGSYYSYPFGTNGDLPAVGDFDADGKADSAVFRPSDSTWYIRRSSDSGFTIQQFGANGDAPVVADYDGDGKSDIAIWRASFGQWWIQKSSNASVIAFQFGNLNVKPVQGDYTGDGKADVAIYRPVSGEWFILRSEDYSYYSFPFGLSTDIPAPGDYDGDGRFDAAVFRPSGSTWYVQRTTAGTLIQDFGQNGDKPVPNAFVP